MKIRSDFVSNSSSSSFVIDEMENVTDNIPFDDFKKAILSLFAEKVHDPDIRIYDLSDDAICKLADEKEKSNLKGWNDRMNPKLDEFEKISQVLKDYGKKDYDKNIPSFQQKDSPLETPIIQTLNILRKNMEIMNMYESFKSGYAKILICFNENVIWKAERICESSKFWHTESMSADRFCELLASKLWGMGYDIKWRDLRYCFHGNPHHG